MFIDPTIILVSSKLDDSVLDRLDPERKNMGDGDSNAYDHEDGPKVTFTTPGDVVIGRDEGYIADGDAFETRQGQLLKLAGWIDVESRVTVGCSGAVLAYIHRKRAATFLPGDAAARAMHRISTIEMFTLAGSMFVNADTLLSLQIVQSESHPHSHNQGPAKANSGSKEGFSVYGLFHNLARTPQGRVLLRQYFLRPSTNLEVINERLDTINFLLRTENTEQTEALTKNLSKIKNMRTVMINLRKGISGTGPGKKGLPNFIWAGIRLFAYHALQIKDSFQDVFGGDRLAIRNKVMKHFHGTQLADVGKSITEIIDFELSLDQGRNVVKHGVDHDLDELKQTYEGLESLLVQVAQHVAQSVPEGLNTDINVVFFPQIGFLIAIPQDSITGHGIFEGHEDDPWEKMFTTEDFAYYKNENVIEMDSYFGDIYGRICEVEVTGPNFSGKSVYLKQVAIVVFMAHVGSFVPASRADIGVTDKIMTRVATRESVSRISVALNLATNRSLLIIDEFGKGTDSHDGAGLAAGVFNHLLERGDQCPKVIGATHFHEIFESGFLLPHERLAFGHFEVRVDPHSRQINEQLTYLYNYKQGRSNNSYGTVCAALNGIPVEVTNRAEELVLLAARGEDLVQACAVVSEREREELEDAMKDIATMKLSCSFTIALLEW
ncbi:hypothetical protein E4T42_08313 [Aureobasidium subglaciale]|nr:hypothetical protein E4T42_08313 [Aureobasidium subglaciale]